MMTKHREHWYRIYITECPMCGSTAERRVRVYGKKPRDESKRYVIEIDELCAARDVGDIYGL